MHLKFSLCYNGSYRCRGSIIFQSPTMDSTSGRWHEEQLTAPYPCARPLPLPPRKIREGSGRTDMRTQNNAASVGSAGEGRRVSAGARGVLDRPHIRYLSRTTGQRAAGPEWGGATRRDRHRSGHRWSLTGWKGRRKSAKTACQSDERLQSYLSLKSVVMGRAGSGRAYASFPPIPIH